MLHLGYLACHSLQGQFCLVCPIYFLCASDIGGFWNVLLLTTMLMDFQSMMMYNSLHTQQSSMISLLPRDVAVLRLHAPNTRAKVFAAV